MAQEFAASLNSPLGVLAFAWLRAVRTESRPTPSLFSSMGLTSARTAGFAPPPTKTCPTPSTCASFWARIESAALYISDSGTVSEVSAKIKMGASAGLDLRYVGLPGRYEGN